MSVLSVFSYSSISPRAATLRRRLLTFILVLAMSPGFPAQSSPGREHQVKAVFLFNFTQFIEWPVSAFADAETPLVIGVLGKNPFGNYLKETVADEKVNKHPLVIRYFNSIEEIRDCHILFITVDEAEKLQQITVNLKGRNILTVGEGSNFLKRGGMIRFVTKDDKIQLQINPEALKAADLTASSQLLRLAEIVVPKKSN